MSLNTTSTLTICLLIALIIPPVLLTEDGNSKPNITSLFNYSLYRVNKKVPSLQAPDESSFQIQNFIKYTIDRYMSKCSLLAVFHQSFKFEFKNVNFDVATLLRSFEIPFAHVQVTQRYYHIPEELFYLSPSKCIGFIVFVKDISQTVHLIGNHSISKVLVITTSSRWKIEEFLKSNEAKGIVNLLVVSTIGAGDIIIRRGENLQKQRFLNLYTHDLFVDGVGGSSVHLITSWKGSKLGRNVTLFPAKLSKGFNGRQFAVVASEQPPFIIKKEVTFGAEAVRSALWDGLEIRLLDILAPFLNFTIEIKQAKPTTNFSGPAEMAVEAVTDGRAEIAAAGIYHTSSMSKNVSFSAAHSVDCATFLTRISTSLPRHRAILGPFHWHVWLALTLTYFIAILPLTFAENHSFNYLWEHPWHIETMFWYVFGTFTNCFTFKGENSWTNSTKNASRMLIGWYWSFSIIITACYTGSIIAFVTLFVFPPAINSVDDLLHDNFRIGSLSTGGWGTWFNNSDDPKTKWLLRDIELVPDVKQGLKNVTGSFYLPLIRPYAFLGSRAHLDYVIKNNYTLKNVKDVLYVSKDCFVPFGVSLIYPKFAPYQHKLDEYILRAQQSGLIDKLSRQMNWELLRSATGQRLQAGGGNSLRVALVQERKLTLDDTQGMFLLLGAGFLIAAAALFSELSGHHGQSGKSWKFWNWRPTALVNRLISFMNAHFPGKSNPQLDPENFIYKTYDSRIINSQLQNLAPTYFRSDTNLHFKKVLEPPTLTASLPNLKRNVSVYRKSSSCNNLETLSSTFKDQATSPYSNIQIRFGSIGSLLTPLHCREVLLHNFIFDRPQTCQI